MTDIKLAPGFWRTRGGAKAEVVGRSSRGRWVGDLFGAEDWDDKGKWENAAGGESDKDLIAPWREPIKGEAWAVLSPVDGHVQTIRLEKDHGPAWERMVRIRYEEIDG